MFPLTSKWVLLICTMFANQCVHTLAVVIPRKVVPVAKQPNERSRGPVAPELASSSLSMPFTSDSNSDDPTPAIIQCGRNNVSLSPYSVVLKNPANGKMAAWCPNAKIGTSTICAAVATIFLGKSIDKFAGEDRMDHNWIYDRVKKVKDYVMAGKEQELCDLEMSFTFIRNPWDRLISAYLEKVATGVIKVPGFRNATFSQFLHALKDVNPNQMNAHFQPVSSRCLTGIVKYTKAYKIEHGFGRSIAQAFSSLGVSKHRTLGVLERLGAINQNGHHGGLSQRQEMFHSQESKKLVKDLFADDIEFGGYEFHKKG